MARRGSPLPILIDSDLVLRPGVASDLPALRGLFDAPEVARWWRDEGPRYVESKLDGGGGDEDVVVYLVVIDGDVAGIIQYYENQDPDYLHAGIDIALHPDFHGRGLGPRSIDLLVRHLFEERGHHRIVIDPAVDNTRAIGAYEKAGFRPVGVMRRYWLDHTTGEWADGLLMERLRQDA